MRRLPILIIAVAFLATQAFADTPGPYDVKDTVKESFKVRPGGTLYLDVDFGNISVESGATDEVQIEVERLVDVREENDAERVLERHELSFEQHGNDVEVRSRFDKERGVWDLLRGRDKLRVTVRVLMPERYNVEFTSGAGNVAIGSMDGNVEGRTGAGNVNLGTVTGDVEIATGSGNVNLRGAMGEVEVSTGAGNIDVQDVQGEVRARTGAGNITAYITRQPRDDSHLESGAGNVTAYIRGDIGVDVNGVASVGSCSTDFNLKVEGKWMTKSFAGAINGGGPELHMRAGVGNVTLRRQ